MNHSPPDAGSISEAMRTTQYLLGRADEALARSHDLGFTAEAALDTDDDVELPPHLQQEIEQQLQNNAEEFKRELAEVVSRVSTAPIQGPDKDTGAQTRVRTRRTLI